MSADVEAGTGARLNLRGAGITAGPAIARQRRRSYVIWAVAALVGLTPTIGAGNGFLRCVGLGLWFPGSGFLAAGAWWWTIVTLVVFAVSLGGWLGVGGFIFPVAVWLGSALVAGMGGDDIDANGAARVILAAALALILRAAVGWNLKRVRTRTATELDQQLSAIEVRTPPLVGGAVGELDEMDLAAARYIFDRALQPIDEFTGFTTIDQFRESAWRYQLVSMNYALASLQVNYAPAFRGYLLEAQANSITKMLDRRAWHYWRIENFIGNLKFGADPIRRENIMLSGWWALALGAFEVATGDRRFSAPGALTFSESERRSYVYDYPSVVDVITRQFDERELCFFPCEPNWVFAICNLFGTTGVLTFDNAHGTRHGRDRLERFASILEREFTTADGRFVMISSRRTGMRVASSSAINPASISWLTNMISPRLAQTYWEIGTSRMTANGPLGDYDVPLVDAVDPGNYRPNNSYFWAALMLSAREMGDEATYQAAAERMAANGHEVESGVLTYRGSAYANLTAHAGRFGSEGTWHRFAWGDPARQVGPYLDGVSYPDVLVARAVSDGRALDLVLKPGGRGSRQPAGLRGLVPNRRYRFNATGSPALELTADERGQVAIEIEVDGRTEVRLEPVN